MDTCIQRTLKNVVYFVIRSVCRKLTDVAMAFTAKQMSMIVATFGALSFIFGVVAENKKVIFYSVFTKDKRTQCISLVDAFKLLIQFIHGFFLGAYGNVIATILHYLTYA